MTAICDWSVLTQRLLCIGGLVWQSIAVSKDISSIFGRMSTNNRLIIAWWSTAIWSIISRCLSWDFGMPSRHRPTISLAYSRKTISRTSIDHRPTTVRLTTAYRSSIYRSTASLTFCVRTETAYSKTGLGSSPLDARQWKWSKSSSASHRTNPDECRWTVTWRACLTTE